MLLHAISFANISTVHSITNKCNTQTYSTVSEKLTLLCVNETSPLITKVSRCRHLPAKWNYLQYKKETES